MFGAMCHSVKTFLLFEVVTAALAVTPELIPPPITHDCRTTHHCHTGRALPYPYPRFSCSGRSILRNSRFFDTEIQFCHSM